MADEVKDAKAPEAAPEGAPKKLKKKKSRPTNCAQSNKRIRRKDWYYRDGKYFANKQCHRLFVAQELEKAEKEKEKQAATAAAQAQQPAPAAE